MGNAWELVSQVSGLSDVCPSPRVPYCLAENAGRSQVPVMFSILEVRSGLPGNS